MDKLMMKYQDYRTGADLEQSPTNVSAQGLLEQAKQAARGAGLLGPETPSIMAPSGDLGPMPTKAVQEQDQNMKTLSAGQGPLKTPPAGTPELRSSTPGEVQAAKAPPTAQEVYDPSQAGLVESSVEAGKSQLAQAASVTHEGTGRLFKVLDDMAAAVTHEAGIGKPQLFEYFVNSSKYWAEHYRGKVSLDSYMTRVVGGILGSGPDLVAFRLGKIYAALAALSEDGDIGDALYAAARRGAAGAVFKSAHTLDAAGRVAAGTAYMTGESVAGQLGQTGTIDPGQTAEAAGVGLGMMLSGGLGPGNKTGMRQRVNPETWFETSKQGNEIFKAFDEGRIDAEMKDLAKDFYTRDLMRGGTALNDTTVAVVDKLNLLRDGVDDWILKEQGIKKVPGKEYKITGKTSTRQVDRDTLKTAIELYQGADSSTLVEEWTHRDYDRLPASERAAIVRAYNAYKAGLAEGEPVMNQAEFYAKGATDQFFADRVAAQKAADRPAWTKAVDAAKARWDSFVGAVRGIPGAKEEGSAPAIAGGQMTEAFRGEESFQAAYHGSPYRFDKFTLDHIGSGEGAQAYGWGLYFAGDKQVAEWYRETITEDRKGKSPERKALVDAMHAVDDLGFDTAGQAIAAIKYDPNWGSKWDVTPEERDRIQTALDGYLISEKGQLYKVTIPNDHTMLDWDKPLSEQPEGVKNALEKSGIEEFDPSSGEYDPNERGQMLYMRLAAKLGKSKFPDGSLAAQVHGSSATLPDHKAASEYLKSIGIPGLRYLDGTSRGKGEGHHNYVVFDDAQIAIDKTYYQARLVEDIVYDPTPAPPLDQKYAEGGNLNLQRINSGEDVAKLIDDVSRHNRETGAFEQATRGTRTWEETAKSAEGEVRVDELLTRKAGQGGNAEQLLAARQLQMEFAAQTSDLVARYKQTGDAADKDAAVKALGIFTQITAARDGLAAEAGRALNIMGRPVGSGEAQLTTKAFADLARKYGGERNADAILDTITDMTRLSADGKLDIEQLSAFTRRLEPASTFDMILEARYIAMLMNPATHIRNTIGNTLALGIQLPERLLAGGIGKLRGAFNDKATLDRVEIGEAAAMLYGGIQGMSAGARAFMQAVRTGESMDPLGKIEVTRRAITAENMGLDPAEPFGKAIDFVAERLRTGNMLMGAEDDFFKAIGYNMEINARAHRTASREGLKGQEFAERVNELVKDPPWDIQISALDFSHYTTFTNALGEGMAKLQSALGTDVTVELPNGKTIEVPTGKLFRLAVPFFRTPTNIVRFGVERSPFAIFMPSVMQAMADGGAKRDMALARITLGSTLGFMAASAATSGLLTGGGPSDSKQKENLRETGWQPYSFKAGDKWISYQALEPFSMIIGAAADVALFSDYLTDNERNNSAMMVASAFANAITSKTFMQGLDGMLNVLSDPDRYGDKYAQQFAASWVPSPVKAARRDKDPYLREVQSVADALQNSLPGYSKELYPRRNRYGEAITVGDVWLSHTVDPMRKSTIKTPENSPTYHIDKAILENNVPIQRPGRILHDDNAAVELTPEEYDDYQMLPADLGLVDALNMVIETPEFKQASGGSDGLKSHMIRQVFSDFREQARYELVERSRGMPGGLAERLELDRLDRELKQQQGGTQ